MTAIEVNFDAIVGRVVLMYRRNPAADLRALVRFLKPGGLVVFQEFDQLTGKTVPPAPVVDQVRDWMLDAFARAGIHMEMGHTLYQTFKGAELCGMDRTNMLVGLAATMQCVQLSSSFDGVLPGDFDGTILPPAGEDEDFVNHTGTSTVNFWKMHVDFANPANTTVVGPIAVSVPAFSGAASVPQKGTTTRLDALSGFTMYRLAYRNFGDHEALVTNHSVAVNTRAAVRWYEFRNPSAPTLFQSGNVKNKTLHFWMGSIAMDKMGDIAAGFSTSSANDFPGIRYAGRTPGLAAGKMQKHAGGNTTNGGGSQTSGLTRWGDYSAMSVDPIDDCTMYYTTDGTTPTTALSGRSSPAKSVFTRSKSSRFNP